MGWKFWKAFRLDKIQDAAADTVFPSDNDLVVDTVHMTDVGTSGGKLAAKAQDFGTSPVVWHCNYFRQQQTIEYIRRNFMV